MLRLIRPRTQCFTSRRRMGSSGSKTSPQARLDGKTVIVTGANTGIGKYTAQDFYTRGAKVIVACRSLDKANEAVEDIKDICKDLENLGSIRVEQLDLSSLKSVRECAARLLKDEPRIDLLVNNAGVMMCPESKTEDNFEMQMGTNHLGHFLFTLLLLPKICQSTPARIVNVSSLAHKGVKIDLEDLNWEKKKYDPQVAYKLSKLANVLFTKELARKLKENNINGVNTYSLHPGIIKTDLARHLEKTVPVVNWFYKHVFWYALIAVEKGAQTTIYCTVDEKCANETGLYYSDSSVKPPSKQALDEEDAKKLWELSWNLVGLEENYNPFVQAGTF